MRQNFWTGLAVCAFALLALNWIIPNYAGVNPMAQMPPDLVPRIASWLMLICGGIIVAGAVKDLVRARALPVSADIDWPALGWMIWPFIYVFFAIYLLTHFKITHIGGPIIAVMLILLGERRWYMILGCSVVPVALLYVLSVYLMRVGVV